MNTFQIHYFLETCKYMNFSLASTALNITQQGLSKAIKALEDELGVELFERNRNKLRLTKYGELARQELLSIEQSVQHLTNTIEKTKREDSNTILIGILEGFFIDDTFDLPKRLGVPKVEGNIVYHRCTKEMCVHNCPLRQQLVDLCITKSPVNSDELKVCFSANESFFAVVPVSNALAERDVLQVTDLADQDLIVLGDQYKFHSNFVKRCKDAGFVPRIHHTVNEISAIFLPCIMGSGIGIVPEFAVQQVDLPAVKVVPLAKGMSEEICVLINKDSEPAAYVQKFMNLFRKRFVQLY